MSTAKKQKGKSSTNQRLEKDMTADYTDNEVAGFEELSRIVEPETPPESAPQPPLEDLPFTVGTWRGFPQWKCKLCPWDTLEGEAKMLEHIASAHAPPKPKIFVADKSGRQIN